MTFPPLLSILYLLSALSSLAMAILALVSRRLGHSSWLLTLYMTPLFLASSAMLLAENIPSWPVESSINATFAMIIASSPFGYLFAQRLGMEDESGRGPWTPLAKIIGFALPVGIVGLHLTPPSWRWIANDYREQVGVSGYVMAGYLLTVSTLTLASLERTLRSAEEHVRWEIKFLVLGLMVNYALATYLATRVLLSVHLPVEIVSSFCIVLLPSSLLMLIAWRRASGARQVRLSQGLAYSSITFVFVGVYLVAASLLTEWLGEVEALEAIDETMMLILLAAILLTFLLSSTARRKMRQWAHRNLFSGKFDYRAYWHEAIEKVQGSENPVAAALALCDMVRRASGARDVSVWIRNKEEGKLRLLGALGPRLKGATGSAELAASIEESTDLDQLEDLCAGEPTASNVFKEATGTQLLVPLHSGGENIGILALGSGGETLIQWESRELLWSLAEHAAGEFHVLELLKERDDARETEAFRTFSTFLLHDLKNFATTLSMIAKNAVDHAENPEFRKDAFESVLKTAEKMKKLCGSLKVFSSRLASNRALMNLNDIVERVSGEMKSSLSPLVSSDLGELPDAPIDEEEMASVLKNLLLNAAEALADSETGRITITTRSQESRIHLRVEDNGPGFSEEFLDRQLFVPFRTTKSDGLGIGLVHCKKIIEAHGGEIRVGNRPDHGARVEIELPDTSGYNPTSAPDKPGRRKA